MHAKAYVFDEHYFFVGSFNMYPRSTGFNREMRLLFDCPGLARKLREGVAGVLLDIACRVYPDGQMRMRWENGEESPFVIFEKELRAGLWRRRAAWCLKIFPAKESCKPALNSVLLGVSPTEEFIDSVIFQVSDFIFCQRSCEEKLCG